MPPVAHTVTSVSPNGEYRIVAEDITHDRTYDVYGWRLRVRMESAQTGRRIGQPAILRYHHSGMGGDGQMPKPIDVRIRWNAASDSVLVAYGDSVALFPGGYTFPEGFTGILKQFPDGIPPAVNDMP